jgi:hypothetical protein
MLVTVGHFNSSQQTFPFSCNDSKNDVSHIYTIIHFKMISQFEISLKFIIKPNLSLELGNVRLS